MSRNTMKSNKVILDGETLIDLTADTVTPETLAEGVTAHDKSGNQIVGTLVPGSGGEQPTLFTPIISIDNLSSLVTISDDNGKFVQGYHLYVNDELATDTVFTSKGITLKDYIEHVETLDIKVQAVGEKFNPSEYSNVVQWMYINYNGTPGLYYTFDDDTNPTYVLCSGIGVATETDITIGSEYDGLTVTNIGSLAFDNENITSVIIPYTVTTIGAEAFKGCTSLKSVYLPETITEIGACAFEDCTSLESIEIPPKVKSLYYTLNGCKSLKELKLHEGFTTFDYYAILYCTNLSELHLPSTVREFDRFSISQEYIKDVYFAGTIEQWATCRKYFSQNGWWIDEYNPLRYANFHINADLKNVVLSNLISIAEGGLGYIREMESIYIPASVSGIGHGAFYGCINLQRITIDENNKYFKAEGNCVISKSSNTLIVGCAGSVIPNGVTSIGEYAFSGSGVESVDIPEGVTTIGKAFFGSTKLKNVTLPNSLTSLGSYTFASTKLDTLVIPDSITVIPYYCFAQTYLNKIVFGKYTTTIEDRAFYWNGGAKVMDFSKLETDTAPSLGSDYDAISQVGEVIVPDRLYDSFLSKWPAWITAKIKKVSEWEAENEQND